MPVFLAAVLIWFFISYQKKKHQNETDKKDALLREQALLIEKQQAIENERTRIASEMHDDLGSGLTTIRYLSDKALQQAKDAGEAEQITRIAEHSNRLVRNMSEIIWAMNARFDNAESLVSYLRRYASEFLEEHELPLQFTATQDGLDTIPFSGERRRNIFLVFKEILHNTIKYAKAKGVAVSVKAGDTFSILILEKDAVGFDPSSAIERGNGLYNIRKRLDAIGGNIQYQKTNEGMEIHITIPLNPPTDGQT
jgi:signal transduction histidine kinase